MTLSCRGVRGATTATENTPEAIVEATRELLAELAAVNGIDPLDVASVLFTTTADLTAAFPAAAARALGWIDTALMGSIEMANPHQPPHCIRVLIHWNTTLTQAQIRHLYLRGAESLRPDRAATQP